MKLTFLELFFENIVVFGEERGVCIGLSLVHALDLSFETFKSGKRLTLSPSTCLH